MLKLEVEKLTMEKTDNTESRSSSSTLLSNEAQKDIPPYELRRKINKIDQSIWTVEDRKLLFAAMEKVLKPGCYVDSDGVDFQTARKIKAKVLQMSHTEKGVQYFIKQRCGKVKRHRASHDTPIDKWVEIIDAVSPENTDVEQQLISTIMAAIEEEVPDLPSSKQPSTSKKFPEPDYGEIYKYLACAVANKPLPDLSPVSALVVEECLQSLTEQIKSLEDGDLRHNLRSIYLHLLRDPTDAVEEDEEDIANQLKEHSSVLNPLAVPQSSIIPVPPNF